MTIKEAFQAVIQIASVDENTLTLGLVEAGLIANDEFMQGMLKDLEIAAIPVLQSLLPITSNSEGGFSQSVNKDAVKERLLYLAKKHNMTDIIQSLKDNPKIKDISHLW